MSVFDRSAELPATDEYVNLLAEAQGPEDVAALIEMYNADVADREALIDESERRFIMPDGTVATSGMVRAMAEQEAYHGGYRNGRRA